jgi:hypothetical protein
MPREGQHRLADIDAADPAAGPDLRSHLDRQEAGTATDVERALARAELQRVEHPPSALHDVRMRVERFEPLPRIRVKLKIRRGRCHLLCHHDHASSPVMEPDLIAL